MRGRLLGSGALRATAWRLPPSEVELTTVDRATDVIAAHAVLSFDEPVARVVDLGADADGQVVLTALLVDEGAAGPESLVVVVLDRDLRERERFTTVPSVGAWEQFREVVVGPDGAVYQMAFRDDGVEVRRWAL